jgi:hypothetical protein
MVFNPNDFSFEPDDDFNFNYLTQDDPHELENFEFSDEGEEGGSQEQERTEN